jgi:N-terminal domain of oxidoreductase
MAQITTPKHYTRIVLAERPETNITPTTFRKETVPFDLKPGPGEILMRVDWISLDPALRTWLKDVRFYARPVQIGEVMRCIGLCTVIETGEGCELRPGDIVCTRSGEFYCLTLLRFFFWLYLADVSRLGGVCRYEGNRDNSENLVSTRLSPRFRSGSGGHNSPESRLCKACLQAPNYSTFWDL